MYHSSQNDDTTSLVSKSYFSKFLFESSEITPADLTKYYSNFQTRAIVSSANRKTSIEAQNNLKRKFAGKINGRLWVGY